MAEDYPGESTGDALAPSEAANAADAAKPPSGSGREVTPVFPGTGVSASDHCGDAIGSGIGRRCARFLR